MRNPYRHSVWIDVFGVLLVGAVLLGGAGYLLYQAGGVASGLGEGSAVATSRGDRAAPTRSGRGRSARRPAPGPQRSPSSGLLLGGGSASSPSGSAVEVPFSEGWQNQATPSLTGPSGGASSAPSSGGASGGDAAVGEPAPGPSGPTIASSRNPSDGGVDVQGSGGEARPGWQAEARQFSGKARALAGQLRQMEESSSEKAAGRQENSKTASGRQASASATSDPGTPSDPAQEVPIGGLGWLAAAGAAYGIGRLWAFAGGG